TEPSMEHVPDFEVPALQAVTARLRESGELTPTPVAAIERRARRLTRRRRGGVGAVVALLAVGAAGVALHRPAPVPAEEVRAGTSDTVVPARPDLQVYLDPHASSDDLTAMRTRLERDPA